MTSLFLTQAAATWALVGLIWTIQLVHYPLFDKVGDDVFRSYHAWHLKRILWVVAPLMFCELLTALTLLIIGARQLWFLVSLVPLIFLWFSTGLIQVPLHNRLSSGFNAESHRRLVRSNWGRTVAWTLRGVCLLYGLATLSHEP